MNTEPVWYFASGSERKGPHTRDQFRSLLAAGTVTGDTLVWASGMPAWLALSRTDLASELDGVPPPIPLPPVVATLPPPVPAGPPPVAGINPPVSPFTLAVRTCYSRYAVFTGRAPRPEFWYFFLLVYVGAYGLMFVEYVMLQVEVPIMALLFSVANGLPMWAVTVRRLHDTDRTGWWALLYFVPLGLFGIVALCAQPGTPGPNRFG